MGSTLVRLTEIQQPRARRYAEFGYFAFTGINLIVTILGALILVRLTAAGSVSLLLFGLVAINSAYRTGVIEGERSAPS